MMLLTHIAEGQKKEIVYDTVLIYDGISGTFAKERPTKVREGSIVTIRYENINPFILQKGMKSESISRDYNEGMDRLNILSGAAATEQNKAAAESGITDESVDVKKRNIPYSNLLTEGFITYAEKLHSSNKSDDEKRLKELNQLYTQKENLLNEINEKLVAIGKEIILVNRVMHADTSIKIATQQVYNRTRENMSADIATRLSMNINKPSDLSDIFYSALTSIHNTAKNIEQLILSLERIDKKVRELNGEGFNETITNLRSGLSELTGLYSGDNLKTMANNVGIIVNNYVTAVSADFWAVDTLVSADRDYLVLSNPKMGINPFKIKTYGGTRVDFSVGIAALYGDVNGWNYTLTRPNDSTMFVVTDKEPNQVTFNPVVFTHIYRTGRRNATWMASVGLSPDVSDLADTKLYLGLSLGGFASGSFARRLIFTAGVTAGHTDILKKKYREVDQSADRNLHSFGNISDSDLTQKAIKAGAFFAISWNLGGVTASEK